MMVYARDLSQDDLAAPRYDAKVEDATQYILEYLAAARR
jgi:hypothetical protein